jgi:TDG/mug DNA glycosylase family protein
VLRTLLRVALHGGRREGAPERDDAAAAAGGRGRAAPRSARAPARRSRTRSSLTDSIPDVLGPGVRVVFCGINPGHWSSRAGAAFANPRNDFWRLLHAAGFTPRELEPREQLALLDYGIGLTNAAKRTTRGSGDLRAADFAGALERLDEMAATLAPRAIGFVGKAAYHGVFRERPEHGLQDRRLGETALFVLPSTSPANAAVPWSERLRWFVALRELVGADQPR